MLNRLVKKFGINLRIILTVITVRSALKATVVFFSTCLHARKSLCPLSCEIID